MVLPAILSQVKGKNLTSKAIVLFFSLQGVFGKYATLQLRPPPSTTLPESRFNRFCVEYLIAPSRFKPYFFLIF